MNETRVSKSKLDADVQTAIYQGLIGLYERLEREHFPRFGHGHHACQKIIAQLSPDVLRDIIGRLPEGTVTDDVTAAIESISPVKIDRWLTPADIEKHGDRWEWHSDQWAVANEWTFTARSTVVGVVMMRNGADYYSAGFDPSDYFTPAKGDK